MKTDELIDYDPEFLDWFFNAQNKRECEEAIREKEQRLRAQKWYSQSERGRISSRNRAKRYYQKIRDDPEKYEKYNREMRKYNQRYISKIKSDPLRYEAFREKRNADARDRYWKRKFEKKDSVLLKVKREMKERIK